MRLINLKEEGIVFSASYFDVPQPMPIYYSTEELWENEPNDTYIFTNIKHIAETFRMQGNQKFKELLKASEKGPRPAFIATDETIVPDAFNNQGDIVFKLKNFDVTITDNCYVKLYDVIPVTPGVCHMITSAGVQAFFQDGTGGDLSAAIRLNYKSVRGWDRRFQREKREKKKGTLIKKYTTSRTTLPLDYKLLYYLLNPLSGKTFLNTHKAAHAAFDRQKGTGLLKNEDIAEIMQSERIQSLIYKEVQKVMPELLKVVKGNINPTKISQWLEKLGDDALKNSDLSIEDKILAISASLQVGYSDEGAVLTTDIAKPPLPSQLTPFGNQNVIQPGLPASPSANALAAYEDEDVEKPAKPQDELKPEDLKEKIDGAEVEFSLTPERIEELKKDVDVMEGYVQNPVSVPFNPKSPLIDKDK